jgi:hypothetical protein
MTTTKSKDGENKAEKKILLTGVERAKYPGLSHLADYFVKLIYLTPGSLPPETAFYTFRQACKHLGQRFAGQCTFPGRATSNMLLLTSLCVFSDVPPHTRLHRRRPILRYHV